MKVAMKMAAEVDLKIPEFNLIQSVREIPEGTVSSVGYIKSEPILARKKLVPESAHRKDKVFSYTLVVPVRAADRRSRRIRVIVGSSNKIDQALTRLGILTYLYRL